MNRYGQRNPTVVHTPSMTTTPVERAKTAWRSRPALFIALAATLIGFLFGRASAPGVETPRTEAPGTNTESPLAAIAPAVTTRYVCPMHSEILSDQPGSCPICGMDLVETNPSPPVTAHGKPDSGPPTVTIPPGVAHNLGIRVGTASRGEMQHRIDTIGKVTRIDPTARRILTPPIPGELIYIADKQQGDEVQQGELLFAVSSDELLGLEKELRDAFAAGDRAKANGMIPRLREMGLHPNQIAALQRGADPIMPVRVWAEEAGIVFARRGEVGEQVRRGFTVFNLSGNYRVVEVTAEIFERQWGWVEEGQEAEMTVRGVPGMVFRGKVVRVEPPVGYTTRSLEIHLKFRTDHPGLSQAMFAHVSILGQSRDHVLSVPADAVIRTGEGARVVRVNADGSYRPVAVTTGAEAGGRVEILSGLEAGARVVASGQFLIDSESSLLADLRRLSTPQPVAKRSPARNFVSPSSSTNGLSSKNHNRSLSGSP